MVKGEPVGDPSAAVVADDREALVPQLRHEHHEFGRHFPLRVPLASRAARRRLRRAVPAQVRSDDAMGAC
jgi:hypothetical protein